MSLDIVKDRRTVQQLSNNADLICLSLDFIFFVKDQLTAQQVKDNGRLYMSLLHLILVHYDREFIGSQLRSDYYYGLFH